MNKKLNKIYKKSKKIYIDNSTKIVIMSDCHRGSGDNFDNFLKNKRIYQKALDYYFTKNFIYIELGDGDEMWEVKNYKEIIDEYLDVFKKIKDFHDTNRLIMVYGNHDIVKRNHKVLEKYFFKYYNKETSKEEPLLDGLVIYESLILNYYGKEMFLLHGHQVDFLNSTIWHFSRFLVRHLWKFLEKIGIKDPTSDAKNNLVTSKVEKILKKWSLANNKILISGHTHRPIFPKIGQSLYFNDGSCIHPNGITAIEIDNGKISLVKWEFKKSKKGNIFVKRKVIEGSKPIIKFYRKTENSKLE